MAGKLVAFQLHEFALGRAFGRVAVRLRGMGPKIAAVEGATFAERFQQAECIIAETLSELHAGEGVPDAETEQEAFENASE